MFEDAYCVDFYFDHTQDMMMFYVSKVDDPELIWPAFNMNYVDFSGLVTFNYGGGNDVNSIPRADTPDKKIMQQVDPPLTTIDTDGWTRS